MGVPHYENPAAARKLGSDWTPRDFEELTQDFNENISRFCKLRVGDFDCEDARQKTFMDAWAGRTGFDPARLGPGGIKGWLGKIARHACGDILIARHPRLIKIGNERSTNIIVNRPFIIPLFVSPSVAAFSVMDMPSWMKVDLKLKDKPTARQSLRGSAPAVGRFELILVAQHDGVQATQAFMVVASADGLSSETAGEANPNPKKPLHDGGTRAKHETIQKEANFTYDFGPLLGVGMDLDWLLACLSKRDEAVIRRKYLRGETDKEIEAALRLNSAHVRRIHSRAMQKLKRRAENDWSPAGDDGPNQ